MLSKTVNLVASKGKLRKGHQTHKWKHCRLTSASTSNACDAHGPYVAASKFNFCVCVGPLESKLSEVEEETQAKSQKLSRLPSKPLQAAHAIASIASIPSSAHHIGHAAQAAPGADGAKDAHAIKPSQRSCGKWLVALVM